MDDLVPYKYYLKEGSVFSLTFYVDGLEWRFKVKTVGYNEIEVIHIKGER